MAHSSLSGFSTQARISLGIAKLIHQDHINLWFSQEFNPILNDIGSNPLKIFEELDSASKRRERIGKVRSVERNLIKWARDMSRQGDIDDAVLIAATGAIRSALESGGFAPVVLHLREIESAEEMGELDEFRITGQNLTDSRRVKQILPPLD